MTRRRLGEGGMGVVYEAYDRQRAQRVALKALSRVSPKGIYRLKQEFRSLADVVHPNLVALYDLVRAGEDWFFTMELVQGQSFIDYVRGEPESHDASLCPPWQTPASQAEPQCSLPASAQTRADGSRTVGPAPARRSGEMLDPTLLAVEQECGVQSARIDLARLRSCLAQLVAGVSAIHAAGKLHRDLKPNNVLVTHAGRVVVLDFGLVQQQPTEGVEVSLEDNLVAGTPAYMAPEQATGQRSTCASDWYAVGAMLYLALTGRLPFRGRPREILTAKQLQEPSPPSSVAAGVPRDLDELCWLLLRTDPALRPQAEEIMRRVRGGAEPVSSFRSAPPVRTVVPLLGRDTELEALDDAYRRAQVAGPLILLVHGEPGAGKTLLVERYLDARRAEGNAVILSGRCFQRELVPYQAFDLLIDGLTRQLGRLPGPQVEALLPRRVEDLLRLFPTLGRVEAIARAPRPVQQSRTETEPRARGFSALKELLARLADRGPLVLWVDDLHWGDLDSAELLLSVLSDPDPPALLLIGSYRDDLVATSPLLQRLYGQQPSPLAARTRRLSIGALDVETATALALELLGEDEAEAQAIAARIVREAGGIPLLVTELARYLAAARSPVAREAVPNTQPVSLDHAIGALLSDLSHQQTCLLEAVAVAGAPLDQAVAARIAQLEEDARLTVARLEPRGVVRSIRWQGTDAVELSQERVRQRLLSQLSGKRLVRLHGELARELLRSGRADPEALARHFRAAGQPDRAAEYALEAGERALGLLAFERAANLFRDALEMVPDAEPNRWELLAKLAEALAGAGHTAVAAQQLVEAARLAPPKQALALAQRATELQLRDAQVGTLFQTPPAGRYTLFDGIERSKVQEIIAESALIEGEAGSLIVGRGQAADSFLVVLSGEVEIRQGETAIAALTEGAVLGEMTFLLRSQRVVDVYAATDSVRVLVLNQETFDGLTASDPPLALKLVLNLSRILCAKLAGMHGRVFKKP